MPIQKAKLGRLFSCQGGEVGAPLCAVRKGPARVEPRGLKLTLPAAPGTGSEAGMTWG